MKTRKWWKISAVQHASLMPLFDVGYESDILQIFRSRTALRRVVGDAPIFGMHYSLAKPGSVSLGDKVPQFVSHKKLVSFRHNSIKY